MFYFTVYVVALCVKMRYVILCIKRLFIDWLIDDYSAHDREAEYCDERVCLCLSVRDHIFGSSSK